MSKLVELLIDAKEIAGAIDGDGEFLAEVMEEVSESLATDGDRVQMIEDFVAAGLSDEARALIIQLAAAIQAVPATEGAAS